MPEPYGLFLGLTTLDIQYLLPRYPSENSKHKVSETDISWGGPAANAAATFAYMGGQTTFCTVVGTHSLSSFFEEQFQKYHLSGIDLSQESPHFPTLASVWSSADTGERTIVTNIRQESLLKLDLIPKESRPDIILVDGFHIEAAIHIARWGHQQNIPVVLDGGSWKKGMEKLLPWIRIAICSADFSVPGEEEVFPYMKRKGIEQVAISRGADTILCYEDTQTYEIEVPATQVVDSLGAGDVLHGAFCWYYCQEPDFPSSLQQAAKIASHSCTFLGAKSWMQTPD